MHGRRNPCFSVQSHQESRRASLRRSGALATICPVPPAWPYPAAGSEGCQGGNAPWLPGIVVVKHELDVLELKWWSEEITQSMKISGSLNSWIQQSGWQNLAFYGFICGIVRWSTRLYLSTRVWQTKNVNDQCMSVWCFVWATHVGLLTYYTERWIFQLLCKWTGR